MYDIACAYLESEEAQQEAAVRAQEDMGEGEEGDGEGEGEGESESE